MPIRVRLVFNKKPTESKPIPIPLPPVEEVKEEITLEIPKQKRGRKKKLT